MTLTRIPLRFYDWDSSSDNYGETKMASFIYTAPNPTAFDDAVKYKVVCEHDINAKNIETQIYIFYQERDEPVHFTREELAARIFDLLDELADTLDLKDPCVMDSIEVFLHLTDDINGETKASKQSMVCMVPYDVDEQDFKDDGVDEVFAGHTSTVQHVFNFFINRRANPDVPSLRQGFKIAGYVSGILIMTQNLSLFTDDADAFFAKLDPCLMIFSKVSCVRIGLYTETLLTTVESLVFAKRIKHEERLAPYERLVLRKKLAHRSSEMLSAFVIALISRECIRPFIAPACRPVMLLID